MQYLKLIIEPFDLTNTARSVYDYETFARVKAVFIASWRILQNTLDLQSIFAPIMLPPLVKLPAMSLQYLPAHIDETIASNISSFNGNGGGSHSHPNYESHHHQQHHPHSHQHPNHQQHQHHLHHQHHQHHINGLMEVIAGKSCFYNANNMNVNGRCDELRPFATEYDFTSDIIEEEINSPNNDGLLGMGGVVNANDLKERLNDDDNVEISHSKGIIDAENQQLNSSNGNSTATNSPAAGITTNLSVLLS